MQFILAFGISFLLPVLMMLLNRAGLVSRQQMVKSRRYAILGMAILAAVVTPSDAVSMMMLLVPLLMLFEGTLLIMWFTERKEAREKAAAEAAASTEIVAPEKP
jgi:sec-independent protein translocase protein TatC